MPQLSDAHCLDNRDIRGRQVATAQLLDHFREVLVDKHHLPFVDCLAQHRVALKRHAPGQQTRFGHHPVQTMAKAGAGDQVDFQRVALGLFDQGQGDCRGVSGTAKTTDADGHAVLMSRAACGALMILSCREASPDTRSVHGKKPRR